MKNIVFEILAGKPVRQAISESCDIKKVNLNKLEKDLKKAIYDYMLSEGFEPEDVEHYSHIKFTKEKDRILINVGAELSYDGCVDLSEKLDEVIVNYDPEAYFDMEAPGLMIAVLEK